MSVADPNDFDAAPAPGQNFDADPAPVPILKHIKLTFSK
jgi:hypothetical protein